MSRERLLFPSKSASFMGSVWRVNERVMVAKLCLSPALDWREKRDFISRIQNIGSILIFNANGHQHRFLHGSQLWKSFRQDPHQVGESASRRQRLGTVGTAG